MNEGKKNFVGDLVISSVIGCATFVGLAFIVSMVGVSLYILSSLIILK
jgi:hypothetical protein